MQIKQMFNYYYLMMAATHVEISQFHKINLPMFLIIQEIVYIK